MLCFFSFSRALFLRTELLCTKGAAVDSTHPWNLPRPWNTASEFQIGCKKTPQISWHLLLLIVRRTKPCYLLFKSLLCVTSCTVNRTSLTARPAGCVFSLVSPRHLLTELGRTNCNLKTRDPHSIHKIKSLHPY